MLDRLSRKFTDIIQLVSGKASISDKNVEQAIDEIKMALLEADVNIRVVRRFINNAMEDARGARVLSGVTPSQQFIKIIHDRIVWLLGDERVRIRFRSCCFWACRDRERRPPRPSWRIICIRRTENRFWLRPTWCARPRLSSFRYWDGKSG